MRGKGIPSKIKKRGQAKKRRNRRKKKKEWEAIAKKSKEDEEQDEDGVSSDTSAEWFDGDEEGTDKRAYQKGGYYKVEFGQKLNNRYTIQKKVGWGHFSTVWLATDKQAPPTCQYEQVALKIQKSAQHYTEAALDEIELLAAAANPEIAKMFVDHQTRKRGSDADADPPTASSGNGGSPEQDEGAAKNQCNGEDMKEPSARSDLPAKPEPAANGLPETSDTQNGLDTEDRLSDQPPPLEVANPQDELHETLPKINETNVVQLLNHFFVYASSGKHVVMVFELLGENLLDVIKRYDYKGLPIAVVKKICREILQGLHHLHDNCHIIHTDLKPENVLLKAAGPVPLDKVKEEQQFIMLKRTESTIKRLKTAMEDDHGKMSRNQKRRVKQKLKKMRKRLDDAKASGKELPSEKAKIRKNPLLTLPPPCVLADLGNACWTHKHFTDDITTRQYRSPESIIGQNYDTAVDIWSLACMAFEFLTGDYLFNAKESKNGTYCRDEDHLALIIELCGEIPEHMSNSGRYAEDYFNRKGELRHIRRLEYWPLANVLRDKYKMNSHQADKFASFLMPMLEVDPRRRATALEALQHPWLEITADDMLNFMNHTKEALEDREREIRDHKEHKRHGSAEMSKRRRRRAHSCPPIYSLELQSHDLHDFEGGDEYHSEDEDHLGPDESVSSRDRRPFAKRNEHTPPQNELPPEADL